MNKHEKFLKIYTQKLKYLNYSKKTIDIYSHYLYEFIKSVNKYSQHLVSSDFQNYLNNFNFSSISQQNQIISSIKFAYERVLNKKYRKIDFKRPRKEKRLPRIIDKDLLKEKILSINNKKHKAILSLAYSCGLRVSEVINLKIEDIDSKRMIINIKQAKGRKDRIVPLSKPLLQILRTYYKEERPHIFLFNGQKSLKYSATSCNKLIKKHIFDKISMHTLRHSSFTHLLESGVDINIIKEIAGHQSIKTTQIYTHVSLNTLNKIEMPI